MVQGTSQIALIYRVYYKCMRTNMNVGALHRSEKGETTLIKTTDPIARVSIPRSLKWNEITFPADWTLENENHLGVKEAEAFGDSTLVIAQAQRLWKVKEEHLKPF